MTRIANAEEAESLDLINKNEAMAAEYDRMTAADGALFAEAGWSLTDLAEVCRFTAGVLRTVLEKDGWDKAHVDEALALRPPPQLRA